MSVKERLKSFIKDEGLSVKAFEESINVSNGYVNSISKSIGQKKLELILEKYPNLNLEWLLTGKTPEDIKEPLPPYTEDLGLKQPLIHYAYVVSIKDRAALEDSFYDRVFLEQLEKEKLPNKTSTIKDADYFKVEIKDSAMDDGSKHSLAVGDWGYCKSIGKQYWKNGFTDLNDKIFCFFHNEHGILFRKIIAQNLSTGALTLSAISTNKYAFPDFKIKLSECSFICNVFNVLSEL